MTRPKPCTCRMMSAHTPVCGVFPYGISEREFTHRMDTALKTGRDEGLHLERKRIGTWLIQLSENDGWSLKERVLLLDLAAQIGKGEHQHSLVSLQDGNPELWR